MPEVVETPDVDESAAETQVAAPTQPVEDVATIKRRLAGKDQALTRTQTERDAFATEAEQLRKKVLDYEQANMTEVQRIQAALAAAEQRATAAEATAQRERLARKFPLSFDALGENTPLEEDALTSLEKRLAATTEESADEPVIDSNSPRRNPPTISRERSLDELKRDLSEAAEGFSWGTDWGGSRS